jgi:hypothetical protein
VSFGNAKDISKILHNCTQKEEISLRRKIVASLLALVVMAAPMTVFGQTTITLSNEQIAAAIADVSQFIVTEGGQTYLPLRTVVLAYGGQIEWDGATRTVTITFNGADRAQAFDAQFGTNTAAAVNPGNFTLVLREVDGRLQVASGPAAGTRLVAYMVNDRFVFPVTPIPQADATTILGMLNLAEDLIATALFTLTGYTTLDITPTPTGVTITATP